MESAGTRRKSKRSARSCNPPPPRGADGVVADRAQTHCPRLEGLVPWSREADVQILMNSLIERIRRINSKFVCKLDQLRPGRLIDFYAFS